MALNKSPMLADAAPEVLRFPVLASAKLDGIRGVIVGGKVWSRSGKEIPNTFVQAWASKNAKALEGVDGELIVGKPWAKDVYRVTNSGVMSEDGNPDFNLYVFDHVLADTKPYDERLQDLKKRGVDKIDRVVVLAQRFINTQEELDAFENAVLDQGYEGLIIRDPKAPYKHGRSTAKQGWMLKLKRYADDEAKILSVEELMSNQNVAKKDAFGHTERSSHLANMVPQDVLGALVVRDLKTNVEFKIGTGFDAATRADLWNRRASLIGKLVKYRHFKIGVKDKPRFPVFLGFRDPRDMS